jgi:branched-chain amino acid transport system substrate-binding protein
VIVDPRRGSAAALAALALFAAACTGDDLATPPTTVAPTTTAVEQAPTSDGRLLLGILLPAADSAIGEPMISAAETAVERINEAGGVLGRPVEAIVADEGATANSAAAAIQSLLDDGVDAIVGPASSVVALGTLRDIVSAGTLSCSPTASAIALDGFPDDDLFFRTVPSDSLQAQAIATVTDQTGAQRAAIAHIDDAYGRAFAEAVESALANRPVTVVTTIPFTDDADGFADDAAALADSGAQVLIVLADNGSGTRFLEAVDEFDTSAVATLIVNDAFRNPVSPQRIARLDPSLRTKIVGVAPQAQSDDPDTPFDPPGPFAANAFDCVNLIALSAVVAGSDVARDIAGEMASVSTGGSVCRTFATCMEALDAGLQIDYNGPSGVTELTRRGDPGRAVFDRFVFDDAGRDELQRTFIVG